MNPHNLIAFVGGILTLICGIIATVGVTRFLRYDTHYEPERLNEAVFAQVQSIAVLLLAFFVGGLTLALLQVVR